jgi:hypothetical protein
MIAVVGVSEGVGADTAADMPSLAMPQVTGCYFEQASARGVGVMCLEWNGEPRAKQTRTWRMPGSITITGPAPVRFGIQVLRRDVDGYAVRLVWNDAQLAWQGLSRRQLVESSLSGLLTTLGTSLEYLLDQPIESVAREG